MVHTGKSDDWVGPTALLCGLLVLLIGFLFSFLFIYAVVLIAPFGFYCAVRGVFVGRPLSRTCAGLSMAIWIWFAIGLVQIARAVR
jgi:hypothetical protein